jgi:DNA repair protein RecN (Recombination protein N)
VLTELRIRNVAVIEQVTLVLAPGLNVLTGETGAGKSLVVGALELLLGDRAAADRVRAGSDRGTVEGVFEVGAHRDALLAFLDEHGLEAPDGVLVLRREVAASGRSRAWVNGTPVTAALLAEVGARLVTVHGQHEARQLVDGGAQRELLDAYAWRRRWRTVGRVRPAWRPCARRPRTRVGVWRNGRPWCAPWMSCACVRGKTTSWRPTSVGWPTPRSCRGLRSRPWRRWPGTIAVRWRA